MVPPLVFSFISCYFGALIQMYKILSYLNVGKAKDNEAIKDKDIKFSIKYTTDIECFF